MAAVVAVIVPQMAAVADRVAAIRRATSKAMDARTFVKAPARTVSAGARTMIADGPVGAYGRTRVRSRAREARNVVSKL
jgi:hypothetical protein